MQDEQRGSVVDFYEDLAEHYHLLFDEWDEAIERQSVVLERLLKSLLPARGSLKILDSACGIGTQAIGFARAGHRVVGSDLSAAAVSRARRETERHGVEVDYFVSNAASLEEIDEFDFDVVASLDNALAHLDAGELLQAGRAARARLRPGGVFVASLRDYDREDLQRTAVQGPAFFGEDENRRMVHQVWDWIDGESYVLHLYITVEEGERWTCRHFASRCRSWKRQAVTEKLEEAGFAWVRWVMPEESGFYQPIVVGRVSG